MDEWDVYQSHWCEGSVVSWDPRLIAPIPSWHQPAMHFLIRRDWLTLLSHHEQYGNAQLYKPLLCELSKS